MTVPQTQTGASPGLMREAVEGAAILVAAREVGEEVLDRLEAGALELPHARGSEEREVAEGQIERHERQDNGARSGALETRGRSRGRARNCFPPAPISSASAGSRETNRETYGKHTART